MSHDAPNASPAAKDLLPALRGQFEQRTGLFRVVVGVAVFGSLALAWYSIIVVLLPQQTRSRELRLQVSQLSAEVDELEHNNSPERVAQSETRWRQAQTQLFTDQGAVEIWLSHLKAGSEPLALNSAAEFGIATPRSIGGQTLAILPAKVTVNVATNTGNPSAVPPYQRLLRFVKSLDEHDKRADLAHLTVNGDARSITSAVLGFNLWAQLEASR